MLAEVLLVSPVVHSSCLLCTCSLNRTTTTLICKTHMLHPLLLYFPLVSLEILRMSWGGWSPGRPHMSHRADIAGGTFADTG